jgi:hypothetical protein
MFTRALQIPSTLTAAKTLSDGQGRFFRFTPYNPGRPGLQTGDEGNFKSKDKEKPRAYGQGYTGFTPASPRP